MAADRSAHLHLFQKLSTLGQQFGVPAFVPPGFKEYAPRRSLRKKSRHKVALFFILPADQWAEIKQPLGLCFRKKA